MDLPEILYSLTARDVGAQWARLWQPGPVIAVVVAGQMEVAINVPGDGPVIITNVVAQFFPGAAQAFRSAQFHYTPISSPVESLFAVDAPNPLPVNLQGCAMRWTGGLIVPPRASIGCRGNFTFVAAANTVLLNVVGIQIPLGTLLLS